MTNLSPIILFIFNRPEHTKKTIDALKKNPQAQESDLFVFCDGPRNIKEVKKINETRKIIDEISGFKTVTVKKHEINHGLANSIISGVGEVLNKFKKAIILEDDIVVAPNFLQFMNEGLDFYENDERVFSISGFNFANFKQKNFDNDVFYIKGRTCSWGWATWFNRFNKVDFSVQDYEKIKQSKELQKKFSKNGDNLFLMLKDQMSGKIDTWDIQFCYEMFKGDKVCILPIKTMVKNIGFDSSGVHCHSDKNMSNFEFEEVELIKFKKIDDIKNNEVNSCEYINIVNGSRFQRLFSKKKLYKLKYILLGAIIMQIVSWLL